MILERVGGAGGVLRQLAELDDTAINELDPAFLRHLHDRVETVSEDVRLLRAEEILKAIHPD